MPSLLELCLRTLGAAIDRYEGLGDLPEELALQLLEVRVFLVRARRAVRACVRGLGTKHSTAHHHRLLVLSHQHSSYSLKAS